MKTEIDSTDRIPVIKPILTDPLESVIAHSPMETGIYLGSPSIAQLPNGRLLVSHDYFGPNCPKSHSGRPDTTRFFVSEDQGRSWKFIAEIKGQYWSSLFLHQDVLYIFGTSEECGNIVIRRSTDGGYSWTEPKNESSGLLFRGYYHCAPTPVIEHQSRLWRAFESNPSLVWPSGFRSFVISAPAGADLLQGSSWQKTNELEYDPHSDPPEFGGVDYGWLEGNVVVTPDRRLCNIIRLNSAPVSNWAARIKILDTTSVDFKPDNGFIHFPGGMSKFTIRFDERAGKYRTFANEVFNEKNPWQRNILALFSSRDLRSWKRDYMVLYIEENENLVDEECRIGFQYVDWLFDDEDIIFVSRTAYQGAHTYHDSNYITFHRLDNFRKL